MKFLAIEGLDGSGKSTQLTLLKDYLDHNKIAYKYLHFPRTDTGVYGDLIARFLRGELGKLNEVNPYLVALIYAGDRHDAGEMIHNWQYEDNLVIVDRYVYSNIAYQCAKLADEEKRKELFHWILQLEFVYFGIPRPDLSVFLDVPFDFVKSKLNSDREGEDRTYLKGDADIHEANTEFQRKVKEMYHYSVQQETDFKLFTCFKTSGAILPPEEIHNRLIQMLKEYGVLS